MKTNRFGFTLIELLIVIALLGALAVGLLAALDPFEQLKKGTDTGVRNTVSELHGSIIRYYGIKNQMPWCSDATCSTFTDNTTGMAADFSQSIAASSLPNMISQIANIGELKTNFAQLAGDATLGKMHLLGSNTNATIVVCYKPQANSFINDTNTKFDPVTLAEVSSAPLCKGSGGSRADCLWCVQ